MLVLVHEDPHQVRGRLRRVDERDRADDPLQARITWIRAHEVDHLLEVDVADDAVAVAGLADREARVRVEMRGHDRPRQRQVVRHHHDVLERDHQVAHRALREPRGAEDDALLVRTDVLRHAGQRREARDVVDRRGAPLPVAPRTLEGSVQQMQHRDDRREAPHERGKRTRHPRRDRLREPHAEGLRQDLRQLEHHEGQRDRERPDPRVAPQLGELRARDRGADRVRGGVEQQDHRDGTVDARLERAPDGAGAGIAQGHARELARRQGQERRLDERAQERHPERDRDADDEERHRMELTPRTSPRRNGRGRTAARPRGARRRR